MKATFKKLQSYMLAMITLLVIAIFAQTGQVSAIPYNGTDTQPSPVPAFNVYTGVPSEGNEADFLRGKVDGDSANSVNNVSSTCENGKRFALRIYVHNGASQNSNDNGNGASVAKNTNVRVALPSASASSFTPNATISASNAASINDTMTITCSDGKTVRLTYVAGTAQQYNPGSGIQNLSDSIVTTGAPIGTMSPNGDMWGCWDQRVWVKLVVEVKEEPKVQKPAVCDLLTITTIDARRVRINVNSTLNDATLTAVRLSLDGKTVDVAANQLPYEYTFTNDGTYDVSASLLTTLNGQAQQPITSANCAKKVTVNTKVTSYKCENVVVTKTTGTRTIKVTVNTSVSGGAAIKSYEVNFGDGTTKTFTPNQEITHTYAKDGNYTVKAKVTYTVDGKDVTKEEKCEGTVNYTTVTPPTTITKTGAGSMVALFVATVVAGYVLASRRYARQ